MKRKSNFLRKEPRVAPWLFSHSWEQRKLGEVVDVCSGCDYKSLSEGTIPVYGTGGYMLSVNKALSYTEDAVGIGRKGTIDKPYILRAPFWTVDTLFYAVPRMDYDLQFVLGVFLKIDWKKKDESTGVPSLSKVTINTTEIVVPKVEEQRKIGNLLQSIDRLITLHQRVQCVTSLLISCEFDRFTIFWEQRKLGELSDITTGKLDANAMTPDGEYDFYTCSLQVYKIDKYAFEGPAITVAGNGYVGCLHLADGKFNAYQRTYVLSNFKATREYLYAEIGNKLPAKVSQEARNGNIPYIVLDMLTDLEVSLPCEEEQRKLADLYTSLDRLITLHQRKSERSENIKIIHVLAERWETLSFWTTAWEQRECGELMEVTSVRRIHQSDWKTEGIRFLRARDIVAAIKNEAVSDYLYISEEKYEECSKISGKVAVGDLLVTGVGTIGVPYLISNNAPVYFKDGNIIWFKNNEAINGTFFYYSFISDSIQSFISESAGIGTVGTYTIKTGKKTPIALPNHQEQQKIGSFFANLDRLITLHQRELKPVKNCVKMAFLITALNNYDSCPLRFTFAWEQREFGETFTFLQNNTLSRADLADSGDGARNIHYGDILVKFGECINIAKAALPIITNESVINKYRSSFLQNGDIVIADTAEDETVGKCAEIIDEKGETIISGLHTIPCRPTCDFARGFLGYYMNSSAFHDQLIPLMQGIKVTSISKSALQTTIVQYPQEKEEQAQIGRMFQQLDRLITLHQREFTHKKTNTNYVKYYQRNRPLLCVLRSMDKSV